MNCNIMQFSVRAKSSPAISSGFWIGLNLFGIALLIISDKKCLDGEIYDMAVASGSMVSGVPGNSLVLKRSTQYAAKNII